MKPYGCCSNGLHGFALTTCLQHYQYCWVVDPIDGTKEFIKRNGEFTVMIGLVQVC